MKSTKIRILLLLLLLVGCKSVDRNHVLPVFEPTRPTPPTLEMVGEVVPPEVIRNTIRLMSYTEQLEVTLTSWEKFYGGLREEWSR